MKTINLILLIFGIFILVLFSFRISGNFKTIDLSYNMALVSINLNENMTQHLERADTGILDFKSATYNYPTWYYLSFVSVYSNLIILIISAGLIGFALGNEFLKEDESVGGKHGKH